MKSLLFCLVLLCSFGAAAAGDPLSRANDFSATQSPRFLPVDEAYQALLSWQDDGRLLVQWNIADGYYLYRDRFSLSAWTNNGDALPLELDFQAGKVKDDPYFGRTEVYYYNTAIGVAGLTPDTAFTLRLSSQGCADAGLCYPPQTQDYGFDPETGQFARLANSSDTSASAAGGAPPPAAIASPASSATYSLGWVLLLAMAGGAILNLMPCVFPVLSLKVLGFANAQHGQTAMHGVIYSIGVVLSFALIAALLIALQRAGEAVGWGFQLQRPGFVAAMATLFFLLSLNLMGVFEFAGRWMNAGGGLSQKGGYSGSFFTGVLATLVASPCTAPFMGTAVGYAATQPPAAALLVFIGLGVGMALPVLLLSIFPGWLRALPKPGGWMIRLRQFLAFPLFATAIWLLWVFGRQTGASSMAVLLVAWLLIGFALWLWHVGGLGRLLAVISIAAAGYAAVLGNTLPEPPNPQASQFDRAQIQQLRQSGTNVFLDVTADWCITCAANERLVLHTREIQQAFADNNVHYLVADWTRYDPAITALLADYQRNGIPLYIYYPADPDAPARILPQILSKAQVLALFERQPRQ